MRLDDAEDHSIATSADAVHFSTREASSPLPTASHPWNLADTARQEIDATLSSYRSTDATSNVSASKAVRHESIQSTSTHSEYSVDSPTESHNPPAIQPRPASPPTINARRRPSIPTQGGTDRRRLAIVQMNTLDPSLDHEPKKHQSTSTRSSCSGGSRPASIHSHRGLALVAPPDASPHSYLSGQPVPSPREHARSSSEAVKSSFKPIGHVPRKSSREVAIVGTVAAFPEGAASELQQWSRFSHLDALKPPLFQMPQSRSPSPGNSEVSDSSGSAYHSRRRKDALTPGVSPIKELKEGTTPVVTPNIGQSKHITTRVAGPIVINLCPESPSPSPRSPSQQSTSQQSTAPSPTFTDPWTPSTAHTSPASEMSPYLYYQPGVHATAGPLPPPPVVVFNVDPKAPPPPRPPRQYPVRRKGDMDAVKQSLQLPPHVNAALKAKSSSSVSGTQSRATASASAVKAASSPGDVFDARSASCAFLLARAHEAFCVACQKAQALRRFTYAKAHFHRQVCAHLILKTSSLPKTSPYPYHGPNPWMILWHLLVLPLTTWESCAPMMCPRLLLSNRLVVTKEAVVDKVLT